MRRTAIAASVVVLLPVVSGVIWLVWAEHEYQSLTYCPWDSGKGHPVLVAIALMLVGAGISVCPREIRTSRAWSLSLAVSTTVLTGVVILVVGFSFGAGLRCTD